MQTNENIPADLSKILKILSVYIFLTLSCQAHFQIKGGLQPLNIFYRISGGDYEDLLFRRKNRAKEWDIALEFY